MCTKIEGKKRTERGEENSKTYNDTNREEASTHAHEHIQCTYLQVCMIAAVHVHTAATGNAVKIAVTRRRTTCTYTGSFLAGSDFH